MRVRAASGHSAQARRVGRHRQRVAGGGVVIVRVTVVIVWVAIATVAIIVIVVAVVRIAPIIPPVRVGTVVRFAVSAGSIIVALWDGGGSRGLSGLGR